MSKKDTSLTSNSSFKDKILYPFIWLWAVIKNFFYDLSCKIHNFFTKLFARRKVDETKSAKQGKIKEKIFVWGYLLIPLVQFAIFYVYVNFNSILLSLKQYEIITVNGRNTYEYVFLNQLKNPKPLLQNFIDVFSDMFLNSEAENMGIIISNSLIAYAVTMGVGLTLSLLFAYVIYKRIPCSGFFQVVLYLPQMVSSIVISFVFERFVGNALPSVLKHVFNVADFPANVLQAGSETAFGVNLFYAVWAGFGTQLILFSGAMARIPDSIIEYGELEGISLFREFINVVFPMIFSTISVFLITGVAGIFTNQLALYNFYSGNAAVTERTLGYEFYVKVIGDKDANYRAYPYASAAGLMFTIVVAPLTLMSKYLLEKFGPQVEF